MGQFNCNPSRIRSRSILIEFLIRVKLFGILKKFLLARIGGSKEPSKLFQFHAVIGTIWQSRLFTPPSREGWRPTVGTSTSSYLIRSWTCKTFGKESSSAVRILCFFVIQINSCPRLFSLILPSSPVPLVVSAKQRIIDFEPHQCLVAGTWKRSVLLPYWLPRAQQVFHRRWISGNV